MSAENCRDQSRSVREIAYPLSALKGVDPLPKPVGHVDRGPNSGSVTSIGCWNTGGGGQSRRSTRYKGCREDSIIGG